MTDSQSPAHDVIVIGGGPAGYVCAIRLAQLGKRVVLIERDRPGGVCLNWGCIPVKALLHAAQTVRDAAEGRRMGLLFQPPEVDLVALYGWKQRIVDRLVRGIEFLFKSNGVEQVRGEARLAGPGTVTVVTAEGERELTAETVIIATGSAPARPEALAPDGRAVIDSDGALKLVELPKRLAVIGAGVIGLEFATMFRRLGSAVTVLELESQVLPGTDPELAGIVEKLMRREGIGIELGVRVGGIERGPAVRVSYARGEEAATAEADRVLVAVGRVPRTRDLGLDAAGVTTDRRGFIITDKDYRTVVPGIYAIGDCRPGPMLAHRASAEGIALADLLAGESRRRFRAIPDCVYTDPEIATVGLSEPAAQAAGRKVKVSRVPLTAVGRSLTLNRGDGLCKLVVDEKTDKVLGAGIVAPQADCLIAEAAVAVELGLKAADIGRVVHPHPTMSELLLEAAEAIHGRAVHVVNR
ncbi:MAG TPA: dihydrolipoyl dehydrogenase [candidate division WOR-3 bacterium]|uniref:Dihydrolipoyl dehydrogenase n=1 Tax=candidate division WOR-3 bacterium TaxID=2052148 RepID=A0A7V0T4K7_UNCW3|nr:dihydrolipoyl dehydrogenase [candidate division WOR-3 bacterium]